MQDTPVTRFLTRMFDSPPEYKFEGDEVEIDAVRENEEYAIDVRPNTGSRGNKANIFTTINRRSITSTPTLPPLNYRIVCREGQRMIYPVSPTHTL